MSLTKIYFPAGLKIDSTYLPHCGEQSLDQGLDELTVFPSGDWAANMTGSKQWAPEFQVDCLDVSAALDLCDLNYIAKDCKAVNVQLLQRCASTHAFQTAVGSAAHMVYALNANALLYWDQISASQGDDGARLQVKLAASIYGGATPLVATGSQTLSNPGAQNAPWTLGPIKLNGTLLDGVTQVSWANNVKLEKIAADGYGSPQLLVISQVRPVITFDCHDVDTICALDADGDNVTEFLSFFRKRRPNKVVWADSDAYHVKLYTPNAATVGTIKWRRVAGSPAKVSCEVSLHRSAPTAALFSYSKNVAIA